MQITAITQKLVQLPYKLINMFTEKKKKIGGASQNGSNMREKFCKRYRILKKGQTEIPEIINFVEILKSRNDQSENTVSEMKDQIELHDEILEATLKMIHKQEKLIQQLLPYSKETKAHGS